LSSTSNQIPFTLPLDEARLRDDLIESPANATAVDLIDAWPDWPGKIAILAGPIGSGKSHIAVIWAKYADANILALADLTTQIAKSAGSKNMVLEDANIGQIDETALFHLINLSRANANHLLITSRSWPASWGVTLPDLTSRLRAAMLVELQEPDDALLKQVIHKQFSDRQLDVDPGVVDYLVVRMERSLGAAGIIVQALDREALARRVAVTKNLAGQVLRNLDMS